MSELINTSDNRATIRWKLLTTASALALTAYVSSAGAARAEESDQPRVWIELGGQLNRLQDGQEIYSPPFLAFTPSIFSPPQKFEHPPRYGFGENAGISFQPEGGNWNFSAAIHYGRSGSSRHVHQQTYPAHYVFVLLPFVNQPIYPSAAKFADTQVKHSETHVIADFQVGRDVGLGMFSSNGTSSLNLGVRIAQFRSKSHVSLHEDPDWYFAHKYISYPSYGLVHVKVPLGQPHHNYTGEFDALRSFHGIGPSLSWKASVPIAGNIQDGAITLDWGLNAAALFGRQKTKTHHETTGSYTHKKYSVFDHSPHISHYTNAPPKQTRSRSVTVPNVGGFAGLSFRYIDAKLSLGYKADFFFGAIDGGIDTAKKENRGFYGPYASISIGLGD